MSPIKNIYTPQQIEVMKLNGQEAFLLLLRLYDDSCKGGINRNLILEDVKTLFKTLDLPL